jgi:hypothetical protein
MIAVAEEYKSGSQRPLLFTFVEQTLHCPRVNHFRHQIAILEYTYHLRPVAKR